MKRSIKLAMCVLLAGGTVGWWLSRRVPQPIPTLASDPTAKSAAEKISEPVNQPHDLPKIVQPFAKTPFLGIADPRWTERRRLQNEDPSYQWRTPIEFFGKVVDEKGQPVGGAVIEYSWSGTSAKYCGDGVEHRTMTSDSNGLFHIHGIEGKGMTVLVSKEGYYRRSKPNGNFEYAGFWEPNFIEPDRSNPVTFHLVKRPVAEPTLRVRQRSMPRAPTLQTRLDLLAKPAETASGGDIVLQITRPPNPGYQNLFDWQLKIEGASGAEIIMSEDEFMLRAPDEGYQNAIAKDYRQVRGNSIETVKFYVRNKARKLYAAVTLEVTPYYPNHATKEDTACYIVSATVNPNDSPNLEYDPAKDIREMAK